jgi:predicted HicB family RNase H-like nuclease
MDEGKKAMTIRIPAELHEQARILSVRSGQSLNSLINLWLARWVRIQQEKERQDAEAG